jgi:hypothetical protein
MLLLVAAALAAAPPPKIIILPGSVQRPHSTAKCPRAESYVAGEKSRFDGKPLQPRKLTELPPGNMYIAVLRHDENGCLDPIVVKYGVSGR